MRGGNSEANPYLLLLCYKTPEPQKGQQGSCRGRWRAMPRRSVAIEWGLCRSGRGLHKLPQPQLLLKFLVIALDDPAMFSHLHQSFQRGLRRQRRQPVVAGRGFSRRPFDQQPFFGMPTKISGWNSTKRFMRWIPPPSSCACRCSPGPRSNAAKPPGRFTPCGTCGAVLPALFA